MDFLYHDILLSSCDLDKLQHVCSQFYTILQSKAFWKEKSEKDKIEPPVTCMLEWLGHRKALLASMCPIPESGMHIKITKSCPFFDSIYQDLLIKEKERGSGLPLLLSETSTIIFRLRRGGRRCDSIVSISLTPNIREYVVKHKRLSKEERRSFVYQVNRGTYKNIIM
ncbi:hypothetical protein [Cedratvirus kamchatka]|uniref:F-box domain-containing protein n=1 Tax=Cedratvirus kamchatka TaxID=2716914 RepID=A0A6G8MX14_9VIRU|nr:hypothetical protein [Cedratvirus kamchatka]